MKIHIPENIDLNKVKPIGKNHTPNAKPGPSKSSDESEAFPPVEPYPQPVDGEHVAKEIENVLNRYMVLPEHSPPAITLWIMFSYVYDEFDCCPILAAISPEKRCGKTSLLSLLTALCQKVLSASNISASAVFRSVEKWHPTLIIDEADTFLRQNDELRGVLNSGHTRATASVIRTVQKGKKFDVERCSTWAPKAIALIGKLPDTLADRSIAVKMRRKRSDERRERIPYSKLTEQLTTIRQKIARWAADVDLQEVDAPEKLDDRAADNWLPLLSIADNIGWNDKALKAALALSGKTDTDTIRTELLQDIFEILQSDGNRPAVPSRELLDKLNGLEERPWSTYHRGKELSGRGLASLLKPFSISSKTIRLEDGSTPKGYDKDGFDDAFSRYLPELSATNATINKNSNLQLDISATENNSVADIMRHKTSKNSDVSDVADKSRGSGNPNDDHVRKQLKKRQQIQPPPDTAPF
jgi:putative DNA primase/helicase